VERMRTYWLPKIMKVSNTIPVIIVGNKIDLVEDIRTINLQEIHKISKVIKPLIKNFKQVEIGLECSAL